MITVIAALCLFTTVKTGITGLQVQTVKIGNNVTMKCDQNIDNNKDSTELLLAWYKQSLGNVPKHIVRLMGTKKNIRYSSDFAEGHFKLDEDTFDLSINETKEEDAAVYYCGKISKSGVVEFTSGTLLIVKAEKTDGYPPTKVMIKSGDSATLQCSVQSWSCSGDHSVYWFRHGSGESDPGIIFTHGNRSDQCKKSSETVSPTQSCIYKLPKNNLRLSDAGTYYCAVAACGHIIFGNGTKLSVVENCILVQSLLVLASSTIISMVVVLLLCTFYNSQHEGSATDHTVKVNQVASNEALKIGFTVKPTQINKDPEIYSHVIYTNKTP